MSEPWMIYGASGYTGRLVADEALRRGHRPVLAGRSPDRLAPLAGELGLPWKAIALDDEAGLRRALAEVRLVLHCAGPFVHTAAPMRRACLDAGAHYLDITGEVQVFEEGFVRDAEARARGVTVMSGVGFDVVPTDCLARHVAARLPGATSLEIAISAIGHASAGTTKSALESLPKGGLVRRGGALVPTPLGRGARTVYFSCGPRTVLPIPWGDLSTAYRTTRIPDITTYMSFPRRQAALLRFVAPVAQRALSFGPLRRALLRQVERSVSGPDEAARRRGRSYVWARAASREAEAQAWLEAGEGYAFTALSAVRIAERVLADRPAGALTPALAFGADFVLEIEGVQRFDALPAR